MRKVNEVSKLFGITRRTLQFYDDKGLLPVKRSDKNYRLYDDEALDRLQEILFYKKLGFKLNEIEELINADSNVRTQLINKKIQALEEAKLQLEKNIQLLEAVRKCGVTPLNSKKNIHNIKSIKGEPL